MEEHIIAERYAKALSQAVDENMWDEALDEIMAVHKALTYIDEAMDYFASPLISYNSKRILLDKILTCGKFLPMVENFLQVILKKERVILLPLMIEEFSAIIQEQRNIALAKISCSFTITEDERVKMIDKLSALTGKNLEYQIEYDASLIAGFIARVGHIIYDYSLSNRLEKLSTVLQKAV